MTPSPWRSIRSNGVRAEAAALNARYGDLDAHAAIELAVDELFPGKVALVSSFGAESSVLLHVVAEVDRTVPVIFLDTGRLFAETLEYRTKLTEPLGLEDVRTVTPDRERLAADDPHRALWMTNPDLCCHIRKTEPLKRAVKDFDAWFTGRKRFQNSQRAALSLFEAEGTRIKINPLVAWSADDLKAYAARHRPAGASAGRQGLPVDRLRAVHDAGDRRRGPALRPLARPRQDRVRHPRTAVRNRRQRHLSGS